MSDTESWHAAWTRLMNRWHARLAARVRPATGFVSAPEPRTVGSFARGRQLTAGNLLFAGHLSEAPDTLLWDVTPPDPVWEAEVQGFGWLDDLAAVGEPQSRRVAQAWLWGWIDRFGPGRGPGWTPELTGRRLIRWINHALFLLRGQDKESGDLFFRALAPLPDILELFVRFPFHYASKTGEAVERDIGN